MTEDEMVGQYHRLSGHDLEQTSGNGDGQGGLACCSPWGHKESDTTVQPKNKHRLFPRRKPKETETECLFALQRIAFHVC